MSSGDVALSAMLKKLREFPELAKDAAPAVADVVRSNLEKQIAAGTDPKGKAWRKRKDAGRPLEGAGKHLRITHVGTRIIAALSGHVARHHLGRARGGIERQVLPGRDIPKGMAQDIERVLADEFRARMGDK